MIVLLMSSLGSAITFLPDEGTGVTQQLEGFLSRTSQDTETVFWGDMAFRLADLQRSGFSGTRWTNGNVYYVFDSGLTTTQQNQWLNAAAEWSAVASLNFIARTSQSNYIYVFSGSGNWSYVGMIGGRQDMSIYNWSYRFIIVHEIGHALGLAHEHQRNDRNSYVTINTGNIQDGYENNFEMWSTTNYGSYDFDSVMHYDGCSFSIDCAAGSTCNCSNYTIEVLPAYEEWQDLIGQRSHLSTLDQSGMAIRYGTGTPTTTPTRTPTRTPTQMATNTPTRSPTRTPTQITTDTPTRTPTRTPTQMLTSTPTRTPTLSPTDTPMRTPTPTPVATRTPTSTPTLPDTPTPDVPPTPTWTPQACLSMGVAIDMPAHTFQPNDLCYLNIWLCNTSDVPLLDSPVFVILEAFGQYFFAPSWRSTLDYYMLSVEPGKTLLNVLSVFNWPSGSGTASGFVFFAAMTDPDIHYILGEYDLWEFGWQE